MRSKYEELKEKLSSQQSPFIEQQKSLNQEEMENDLIPTKATKKERDIYSKHILPSAEINAKRHNLIFSGLSKLFQITKSYQKVNKQIQNEDVKDFITKSTQVKLIIERLEEFKRKNPKYFSDPQNFNLFQVYLFMTKKNLFIGMLFSVLQSSIGCGCIFLMDLITDKLKVYEGSNQEKRDICLLLLLVCIGYIIKNIFFTQYEWFQAKWQANAKATLQYLVFNKSLKTQIISGSSNMEGGKSESKNDEDASYEDNPDINNIMTVDIDQSLYLYWDLVETVDSIITIIIVLALIYYKIGKAIINGLYILVAAMLFNIVVSFIMEKYSFIFVLIHTFKLQFLKNQFCYKYQYKRKDQRVSLSKDVIEGMKSIKYLGWENIFKRKIDKIRRSEFRYIISTRSLDGVLSVFWNCVTYFLLFFFLVNYVNEGNDLKDSNVFTIIALFGVLTEPIGHLPLSISYLVKAKVTFTRIQKFMNEKEIDNNNQINLDLEMEQKQNSLYDSLQEISDSNQVQSLAIQIRKMKFVWPAKKGTDQIKKELENQKKKKSNKSIGSAINEQLIDNQEMSLDSIKQQKFELKIFDFSVNKGDLAIIIGKIGWGKSTLIHAILNELDQSSMTEQESILVSRINDESMLQERLSNFEKKIILNGRVGYVSQNHWLQNKTIKENILFGKKYDAELYNQCIEACDLKVDFNTFSKKDDKLIGTGGGNLSGGQRQRIAICRAIYQNPEIFLFDDIFSSLDAHVAEKIYQNVILDFLIKKQKKTVLLVTSHFSIFENRQNIQKIFYLQKGTLVYDQEQLEEFIKTGLKKENVRALNKCTQQSELNQLVFDDAFEIKQEQIRDANQYSKDTIEPYNASNDTLQSNQKQMNKDLKLVDENEETKKEEEEEREKGSIKTDTFKTYFKSMGLWFILCFFIFNFLMQGSQMIVDFWLRDYVSLSSSFFDKINHIYNSFSSTFLFLISINIGLAIMRGFFYCLCALLSGKRLFTKLNKSLIYSKMTFFDKNPVGRIVNRISDDILCIDDFLPQSCCIFMEEIAQTCGYLIGITVQFPWFMVFVVISIGLIYLVQKLYRISNREIKRLNSVNSGKVLTVIGEVCKGLILVRSFDREKFILKEYMEKLNDSVNSDLISHAIQIWMSIRLLFISNFLFICVAATSAVLILANIDFDYNTIAMCLTYSILLSSKFSDLIYSLCTIEQNMVCVERIRQYFNNDQEEPEEIEELNQQLPTKNNEYAIEFENVFITYDEIKDKNSLTKESKDVQFALNNVNLKIKKGEKIAFCGRTGSGKTSILNTLFNMYQIQFGNIYVYGKNIKSYSLRELRQQMSIIPQFGFLFNASLKDNLDPEGLIPRDVVQKKINDTNLRIRDSHHEKKDKDSEEEDEEQKESKDQTGYKNPQQPSQQQAQNNDCQSNIINIQNLEKKDENLDFEIEDGGENLSNGEKQIVNFLRIILRETDIVCLDEATSNMDPKTDAELHEQIFKFAADKTLLVITHRLENIELFDRVVVLDQGKIVECGHVSELRKIEGGFFNKLLKKNTY